MQPFDDAPLVDFGEGRRLERFAGVLVDRPCPGATGSRRDPAAWPEATAVYSEAVAGGSWHFAEPPPSPWVVGVTLDAAGDSRAIRLHVRPAPSGQLGVFPEQIPLWRRLHGSCASRRSKHPSRPRILSLFAHTGGASLSAAAAGAEVYHVDASRQAIKTARDNAEASGLADAPIHWVAEDAVRYCRRLVRRDERFDAIILDPPSYGHGPRGEAFAIDRDLPGLLAALGSLLADDGALALSCHSVGWDERRLEGAIAEALAAPGADATIETGPLVREDDSGRRLDLGRFAIATRREKGDSHHLS